LEDISMDDIRDDFEEYEETDLITLVDEEGNEVEFEHIDSVEVDGEAYIALSPVYTDPAVALSADGELLILRIDEDEQSGEEILSVIDDDDEYDEVAQIFEDRLKDLYEIES